MNSSYEKVSTPDSYKQDCSKEDRQKIFFPLTEPEYAVLHFDRLFKFSKRLTFEQTEIILNILNDSNTYIWGEIGTPYFDRFITFHNKNNECIGITQLSFDGQTYSQPSIAKMKWGMLSDKGFEKIMLTIKSNN